MVITWPWLFTACADSVSHLFCIFIPYTISSFSLSFCTFISCPTLSFYFSSIPFIYQSYHYSFPLSFLLLFYVRIAPLHLIFLSFIPFVLSSPFLLSIVFYFLYLFFSHIVFPIPSFPPSHYVKNSLGICKHNTKTEAFSVRCLPSVNAIKHYLAFTYTNDMF